MKNLFKDKKWWLDTLKFVGIGIVINAFCFFVCAFTGHCANLQNAYPYYINETYSASGTYNGVSVVTDNINDLYDTYFANYQDFIIQDFITRASLSSSDKFIVTVSEVQYWTSVIEVDFYFYVNPVATSSITDSTIFSQTATSINATRYKYRYQYRPSQNDVVYYSSYGSPVTSEFYIMGSANFQSGRENWGNHFQILQYPLFMVGFDNGFYSANNLPVIAYSGVSIGDFTELPELDSLLDNITNTWEPPSTTTGHALPSTPQENTNNTPFQDRLQMFQYLADTITQNFGNLGYNLQNFFNKIQQKLTDVANSISQNIYNGFKTLMDNIRDFFGSKLDKIIELLSQFTNNATTDFNENWDNSQVKQDFDSISQSVETSFTVWSDTSEPNEFKIPLHVENVAILHCNQVQYIDLGLFSPVLPYIRTIMWALMVYSLVYTIIDSLASYINGGDE